RSGLAYAQAGRSDLAIGKIKKDEDKKANREIKDLINRMSGMQIWLLRTRMVLEETNTDRSITIMVSSTLTALIICSLAAYFINRQIRERQIAMNLLKSSEERFRTIAENANDAFVTTDKWGKII